MTIDIMEMAIRFKEKCESSPEFQKRKKQILEEHQKKLNNPNSIFKNLINTDFLQNKLKINETITKENKINPKPLNTVKYSEEEAKFLLEKIFKKQFNISNKE